MSKRLFVDKVSLLLPCVILLTGCASYPFELLLQPLEADRQLGEEVAQHVTEQFGIVDDPELTSYLDEIGQRLTASIPQEKHRFDYKFQIVDQVESNAFAAPGGYVYVSRGLLVLANSEDELANVIGHEIVHVGRRHTAKQLAKERLPGLLSLPGRIVGRVVSRDLGRLLNSPLHLFGAPFMATYSRQHELEADRLGQQLTAAAGYDPLALAAILDRLEEEAELLTGTKRRASFLDTHPTTPRRVGEISSRAATIQWTPRPGIAADHAEFLRHLEGLLVGANPANGVFQEQRFLHPDLDFRIEFPQEWETVNTKQAVGAISPTQDGLAFVGIQGEGTDPEEVARKLERDLVDEFGVAPSRSEAIEVGKLPGYVVTFTDRTGSEPMHMHFLWVAHRGLIYQMIALAPESLRDTLRAVAFSFGPLTPREKASIKETRLRVVEARERESLLQLSERTGNVWNVALTALVNGIDIQEPLERGQLIKVALEQQYEGSPTTR
jgi:predicted Zn-dependent protease